MRTNMHDALTRAFYAHRQCEAEAFADAWWYAGQAVNQFMRGDEVGAYGSLFDCELAIDDAQASRERSNGILEIRETMR